MIDPNTGEEQINPLESMIESTILQNESMKEQGQETNALLEAIVLQGNSVEPLLEAQIIQSQKNNKELKEALKESTFNFQIDGVEMASITGPQGEKGEKGDKGDDGAVSLEMPDGTIERKEGKIVVKGLKGDKGDKGEQGEKGESGKDGVDGKVIFGANGRNGLDGIDGKDGVDGANGRDGSPDTPKQIKKKLESLKDDERLDVKAIKGIKDFQKQLDRVAGFASQGQEYRISGTKVANNSGVLNFVAGSGATITGVPTSDGATITIGASGGGGAVDSVNGQTGVVVLDQDDIGDGTTYKQYSQTEKTKLAGIETGAEVNTIDTVSDTTEIDLAITARDLTATLKNGSIDESKLDTSVNTSLDLADTAVQPAALSSYQLLSEKDQTNGYAGLDGSGKINSAQIPDIALSQFLGNFTDTTAALANAGVQASQIGDWFTVDTSGGQSWIVTTSNPTTLSDITQLKTPTDAVTSVFSRTGTVTAQNGDYTASNITNVPAGNIAATDVQAALNELDTEKGGLAVANTWTAAQSISTNTSGQQIFLGTTSGGYGYWIGRNSSTGFLDFVGTQGSPFDGIQCAVLRASSSITINGENVIRNWSGTLGLGSGSGTPGAILEVRGGTQDFMIGGGSGTSYVFQRNSGTGFMEITGQQSGYTGYIFNTANGTNAHTINDSGNNGFGVAIGSILAKVHVGGTLLAQKLVEANTAGSGSPNVITSTESGTLYTNEGATALNYHTLPTAVAGLTYTFYVDDADGIRVTANTGDIIQINGVASASAGYAECTAIGGCLTLTAINATDWVATSVIGSWSLT